MYVKQDKPFDKFFSKEEVGYSPIIYEVSFQLFLKI